MLLAVWTCCRVRNARTSASYHVAVKLQFQSHQKHWRGWYKQYYNPSFSVLFHFFLLRGNEEIRRCLHRNVTRVTHLWTWNLSPTLQKKHPHSDFQMDFVRFFFHFVTSPPSVCTYNLKKKNYFFFIFNSIIVCYCSSVWHCDLKNHLT